MALKFMCECLVELDQELREQGSRMSFFFVG